MERKGGFTIVELLIVIVVIAILAVVSVVAYTNISARASISAGKSFDSQLRRAHALESVLALNFDEGSGTTTKDSSEQANNATVNGSWTAGMEGGSALKANNNGTGAIATNPIYFENGSFTISAWVNSSDHDGAQSRILGAWFSAGYFFLNFGNGRPYIEARDSASASANWYSHASTDISGKWAHVVAVIDREQGRAFVYINGKLEGRSNVVSSTGVFGDSSETASNFRVGHQTASATLSLDGIIDDVYIYKSALNVARIEQLYKDGAYRLAKL